MSGSMVASRVSASELSPVSAETRIGRANRQPSSAFGYVRILGGGPVAPTPSRSCRDFLPRVFISFCRPFSCMFFRQSSANFSPPLYLSLSSIGEGALSLRPLRDMPRVFSLKVSGLSSVRAARERERERKTSGSFFRSPRIFLLLLVLVLVPISSVRSFTHILLSFFLSFLNALKQ